MLSIGIGADKSLHVRLPEKTINVVIVPHEIRRKLARFLLLAKLRRNRLKLLNQSIAGLITRHGQSAVVDDVHAAADGMVESPRADILRGVRRDCVESGFQ